MTLSINEISTDPGFGHDLPPHTLRDMLRYMMLARALDERMWVLNRAGKAPFVISCQGHEAAQVGAAFALMRGKDFILPYYRGLATVLVMGMTPTEVMLGLFARATDPSSGGRQMPAHYGCRRLKIVTQSSPVGTQIPHAAGIGLAEKIKGGDAVVWVSFGEGTTSQGDFHEGVNLAAVHRLPVISNAKIMNTRSVFINASKWPLAALPNGLRPTAFPALALMEPMSSPSMK